MDKYLNQLDRRCFLAGKLVTALTMALAPCSDLAQATPKLRRKTKLTVQLLSVDGKTSSVTIWSQSQPDFLLSETLTFSRSRCQGVYLLVCFQSDNREYNDDYRLRIVGSEIQYHFQPKPGQNFDGRLFYLKLCECDW